MPLKPFTLEDAKRLARPVLAPFRAVEETRERFTSNLALHTARNDAWSHLMVAQFQQPYTPKPFNGNNPTRILIFKAEGDYSRIVTFYFGKRTRPFDWHKIYNSFYRGFKWLEFDRESPLIYWDFAYNKYLRSNLAQHYYPNYTRCGVEQGRILPVEGIWSPSRERFVYAEPRVIAERRQREEEVYGDRNPT